SVNSVMSTVEPSSNSASRRTTGTLRQNSAMRTVSSVDQKNGRDSCTLDGVSTSTSFALGQRSLNEALGIISVTAIHLASERSGSTAAGSQYTLSGLRMPLILIS